MAVDPTYHSDTRPDFAPFTESCGTITGFAYDGDLAGEIRAGTLAGADALALLDDMLAIRELEEMIVRLRSGGYDPLPGYDYRGPTHVSIGQEASPVGACSVLRLDDNVTSSHRGHGDAIAKGFAAIRTMSDAALRARVPGGARPRQPMPSCSRPPWKSTSTASLPSFSARRRATRGAAAAGCTSVTSRPGTWVPTRSSAEACRSRLARRWRSGTSGRTGSSAASRATVRTPTAWSWSR